MYTLEGRVRYSEIDGKGQLTIPAFINYLQDCCTFQAEDAGIGLNFLMARNRAWFLNSWQIELLELPHMAEEIFVRTWAYKFQGFYGFRNFLLEDKKGKVYAKVNSLWIFMDTTSMRPVRIESEIADAYGMDPEISGKWPSRKISLLDDFVVEDEMIVTRYFLDTNHHVNNEKYVELALTCVPEDTNIRYIRVEYKSAAVLGDKMVLKKAQKEDVIQIELGDGDSTIYAVVELQIS